MSPSSQKPNQYTGSSLNIVGIGASAGGLEALKAFFENVPEKSGLAYVVIVHLSPDHKSHLSELLQLYINIPIKQVTQTMQLEPDHIYVIPPGCNLNSVDTHLRLTDLPQKRNQRAPIDYFFRTLANTHDGNSVGIILTGTGSDGTLGIKEIKRRGGFTIVQDPNEAEFDGMPQSALTTGLIDLVLPVRDMPQQILRLINIKPRIEIAPDEEEDENYDQQILHKIFIQIQTRTGRNFSRYKRSTILRRVQRRMQLAHVVELKDYLDLLKKQPQEIQALSDEFLITVTNFFRDPKVFNYLKKKIIPGLFNKNTKEPIRVWSVGCATGEEAYSLAILLLEEQAKHKVKREVQLFASDLSTHSLSKGRHAFYPGDIESEIDEEYLKKYFNKQDNGYTIKREVRELVVFAPYNLLSDPPFSHIDLLVCRNLLIYLQRDAQRDIIELFHYSLRPGGILVLGSSESIDRSDYFMAENKRYCVFKKRNVPPAEPKLPVFPDNQKNQQIAKINNENVHKHLFGYGQFHQQIIESYAPPSVLVSPDNKIVHFSEHAGRYFHLPGGEVTSNIFKLIQPELHIELRSALHEAKEKGVSVTSNAVRVSRSDKNRLVTLNVHPAVESMEKGFAVVIFNENDTSGQTSEEVPHVQSSLNSDLQLELEQTRHHLQAIIEEYETSQEEMKASNEEMQSVNEELRSTLEELETSKEELQSMNEELATMNQENRLKVEELSHLSGDLQNLMKATDIATLFLDKNLRILRFTPSVGSLFNIRNTDSGRPLSDITHRLGYNNLIDDSQQVLDNLVPIQKEIYDEKENWYLTRILPYRSDQDRIEGVVITFVDITAQKNAENKLLESKFYSEQIINSLFEPLLVLDKELMVHTVNEAFCELFGVKGEKVVGQEIFELLDGQRGAMELKKLLKDDLPKKQFIKNFELTHTFKDAGHLTLRVSARMLDHSQRILFVIQDITALKAIEESLKKNEQRLRLIMESARDYAIFTLDNNGVINDWNNGAKLIFGYSKEEVFGKNATIVLVRLKEKMKAAVAHGRVEHEGWYTRKDGSRFWGHGSLMPLVGENNAVLGYLKILTNETQQKEINESLKQAKNEAEQSAKAKEEFLAHMSHEIRTPLNAIIGLSTLLLGQDHTPSQAEHLNTLKFSADNLRMLVNNILDFSKLQAGKAMLETTHFSLKELLNSLQKSHEPRAGEQNNKLRCVLAKAVPEMVKGDKLKISQVLHNLVGNAVKFTKDGNVTIKVTLAQQKGKKYWVNFAVQDTGAGIPKHKLSQIFEAFTQVDSSSARKYEGTGLGLTISKLLVEIMGSQLRVESRPGKGSTFSFTTVMNESKLAEVDKKVVRISKDGHKNWKILLVEDIEVNRSIIKRFMKEWWELSPDEAENGKQAVELVKKNKYDLILLDVRMPVMDGYNAVKKIRELTAYRSLPILALTADTEQEVRKHAESKFFTDIIIKPFEPNDLYEKILAQFQKEKASAKENRKKGVPAKKETSGIINPVKLEDMLGNDEAEITSFYKSVLDNLPEFRRRFTKALESRDTDLLIDIKHQKTVSMDMLGLTKLKRMLERGKRLIKEKAEQKKLDNYKKKVLDHFLEVEKELKEKMESVESKLL